MREASASDLVFFQAHALAKGFTNEELWRLEVKVERLEVETGTTLCRQGAPNRGLYFIRSGEVRISQRQREDTEDLRITDLEAPTVVGEMELLSGGLSVATVKAKTPLVTFLFPREVFQELLVAGDSMIAKMVGNIAQVLVNRLMEANGRYLAVVDPKDFSSLSEALTGCWERAEPTAR